MRVGWGWIQRAAALALIVGSLLGAALYVLASPEVAFVGPSRAAPWIMAPLPVSAGLEQWGRSEPPATVFTRALNLEEVPARARLRVRALRHFSLRVNGQVPGGGADAAAHWRRAAHQQLYIA